MIRISPAYLECSENFLPHMIGSKEAENAHLLLSADVLARVLSCRKAAQRKTKSTTSRRNLQNECCLSEVGYARAPALLPL